MDLEFLLVFGILFASYIAIGMIIGLLVVFINGLKDEYFILVMILYPIIIPILVYFELKRFVKELKKSVKE